LEAPDFRCRRFATLLLFRLPVRRRARDKRCPRRLGWLGEREEKMPNPRSEHVLALDARVMMNDEAARKATADLAAQLHATRQLVLDREWLAIRSVANTFDQRGESHDFAFDLVVQ